MRCPECQGKGEILAIACPGFKPVKIPCELCRMSGELSPEQAQWVKEGEAMRKDRVGRGLTLRAEAQRRGMDPLRLSHMERGIVKPEK